MKNWRRGNYQEVYAAGSANLIQQKMYQRYNTHHPQRTPAANA